LAVSSAAKELVERAREGGGPGFMEAVTYRWYGHVDWREDVDVGVNRSRADVEQWCGRDPVRRLRQGMIKAGFWSEKRNEELETEAARRVSEAWAVALTDPYPDITALLSQVYSDE
jgi:pyruvate dehydrogenase E1 component alpha subunit